MTNKTKTCILSIIIFIIGAILIVKYSGYGILAGIFFLQWANNINHYIQTQWSSKDD